MTTGNDLCSGALRVISSLAPGENIPGAEADLALSILNSMLAAWSAESLMPPYRTLESFALAAGIATRTIGTGAQLDTVRPDYVTDAWLRDASGSDTSLTAITKEQYNAIVLKSTISRPGRYYYDTQYPNGVLYLESATDRTYTLFLESLKPLNQFTNLQTVMALPGEYQETIKYLLAERLAPEYGFPIPPDTRKLIEDARARIMRKNVKRKVASYDAALLTAPPYNIFAG